MCAINDFHDREAAITMYRLSGEEFKEVRERAGYSAREVAEAFRRAGITKTTARSIYRLENEEVVDARCVRELRQLIGTRAFRVLVLEVRAATTPAAIEGKRAGPPSDAGKDVAIAHEMLMQFLSEQALIGDVLERGTRLARGLEKMLGDVDTAAINFNVSFPLRNAEGYDAVTISTQMVREVPGETRGVMLAPRTLDMREPGHQRLLEGLASSGYDFAAHHPPVAFNYYHENIYLGTILLLRSIDHPAISAGTIAAMNHLEPLLCYMLHALSAGHQAMSRIEKIFYQRLDEMANVAHLTENERRAALLLLQGHLYKEIAPVLNITVNAVGKRIGNVYRKTGTTSVGDLFAKFFTLRIEEEGEDRG